MASTWIRVANSRKVGLLLAFLEGVIGYLYFKTFEGVTETISERTGDLSKPQREILSEAETPMLLFFLLAGEGEGSNTGHGKARQAAQLPLVKDSERWERSLSSRWPEPFLS